MENAPHGLMLAPAVSPLLAHGLNFIPHSGILFSLMAEKLAPNEIVTLVELVVFFNSGVTECFHKE